MPGAGRGRDLIHDVGTPAIHNHPDIADRVARAVEETFGREHLQVIPEPLSGQMTSPAGSRPAAAGAFSSW